MRCFFVFDRWRFAAAHKYLQDTRIRALVLTRTHSCFRVKGGMGGFILRHGSKYNGIDAADQGWSFPPLREGTPALHRDIQIPEVLTESAIVPGASDRVIQRFQCLAVSSRRPHVDEDVKRDLVLLTTHAVEGGAHFHVKQIGPGHYLLRNPVTKATFKVMICTGGRPCDCAIRRTDRPCIHLLFILLKVLGMPLVKVLELGFPLTSAAADRVLKAYQGSAMPYKSGMHQWKVPLELSALQPKHKMPTWTLKDDLASVEYRPPRPEHLATVQALCRVPCVYEACGGQVIVDDPSRPLSTLPISFYPKGLVLPQSPFVAADGRHSVLYPPSSSPPLGEVCVQEFKLVRDGPDPFLRGPTAATRCTTAVSVISALPEPGYPYFDEDNCRVVAPGGRIEPGHRIRSPSCLRPTKFKADLKDFLVVWDLAAEGKPKQDLAQSINNLWIFYQAFRNWVGAVHKANRRRCERASRLVIDVNVHLPNTMITSLRVCPMAFGWDVKMQIYIKRKQARVSKAKLRRMALIHDGREIRNQEPLLAHEVPQRGTLYIMERPLP